MTIEDQLRAALAEDAPEPLDGMAIVAAGRRRRAMARARIGAAAAAVVLIGGVGWQVLGRTPPENGAALAPAASQPDSAARDTQEEPGMEVLPGRRLLLEDAQWCLTDGAGRMVTCAPRVQRTQQVVDDQGQEWLVALAPSGPATAALQVEQSIGWVSMSTTAVAGGLWFAAAPSTAVPEPVRAVRGLDDQGHVIWQESV